MSVVEQFEVTNPEYAAIANSFLDEVRSEEAVKLPECLVRLGFSEMPADASQVRSRYRQMARAMHPDAGGDASAFTKLHEAYEEAMTMMEEEKV